jgi:hypothetical protein
VSGAPVAAFVIVPEIVPVVPEANAKPLAFASIESTSSAPPKARSAACRDRENLDIRTLLEKRTKASR